MVIVIGHNGAWQKTYQIGSIKLGQVNRIQRSFESAAGKGANTCRVLGGFGIPHQLHGYVGGSNGKKYFRACQDEGIETRLTTIGNETRICTTLLEENGTMTELVEPAPEITHEESLSAWETAMDSLGSGYFLAICGTAAAGEDDDCYLRLVQSAQAAGIPTILDSYRMHGKRALEAGPEILKINQDELAELSGLPVDTSENRILAYKQLSRGYGLRWIIITQGKLGAEAYNGNFLVQVRTPEVRAINPIGSGDSVTAGIITAIVQSSGGEPIDFSDRELLEGALSLGIAAGTANVLNIKPGHIEPDDLKRIQGKITICTQRVSDQ